MEPDDFIPRGFRGPLFRPPPRPPQPTPTIIYPRARPQPLPPHENEDWPDGDFPQVGYPQPSELDINQLRFADDNNFPEDLFITFDFQTPPEVYNIFYTWLGINNLANPTNRIDMAKPVWLAKYLNPVQLYNPVIQNMPYGYDFPVCNIDFALYFVYDSLNDYVRNWPYPDEMAWNLQIAYNCIIDAKKKSLFRAGVPFWIDKRGWNDGQYIEAYDIPQWFFPIDPNPNPPLLIDYLHKFNASWAFNDSRKKQLFNWMEKKTGVPFIDWPDIGRTYIDRGYDRYFGGQTPMYKYYWPTTALDHALYALYAILMKMISQYPNNEAFEKEAYTQKIHAWNIQIAYNCLTDLKVSVYQLGSPVDPTKPGWNSGRYIEAYEIPPSYIPQDLPRTDWIGDNLLRGNDAYEGLPPEWIPH